MEDEQKCLNCSFIELSSDESSDTSPSKSSIEKTLWKQSGDLTLIGFSVYSLDSVPSPSKSGKTIICDDCPGDDEGMEPEQQRPLNVTLLEDSDEEEMEETVHVSDSDCSSDELDEKERDTDGKL